MIIISQAGINACFELLPKPLPVHMVVGATEGGKMKLLTALVHDKQQKAADLQSLWNQLVVQATTAQLAPVSYGPTYGSMTTETFG
jgi:hypothetical protein